MRFLSLAGATAATLALASLTTFAADLPQRPEYKAPVMVAPVAPWTGCYIGADLGAGWGEGKISSTTNANSVSKSSNAKFVAGGQIGCDYQVGAWVFGIRNLTNWADLSNSRTFANGNRAELTSNWFDLLTGRVGYTVQPNWLLYFQGGGAYRQATVKEYNAAGTQIGQISNNKTGWTVGAGSEYKFAPHWSVFAEYNYVDFGTTTKNLPSGIAVNVKGQASLALFGVNYRF